MSASKYPRPFELIVATSAAAILPVTIHFATYAGHPFFPYIITYLLKNTSLVVLFFVLPAFFLLRHFQRFNGWNAILVSGAAGLILKIADLSRNEWGTGGYTTYGAGNYRLVEDGMLTTAGIAITALGAVYFVLLGVFAGLAAWFLIHQRHDRRHDRSSR
jgi:hypothetical protein